MPPLPDTIEDVEREFMRHARRFEQMNTKRIDENMDMADLQNRLSALHEMRKLLKLM